MSIENTSDRDNTLHFLGLLTERDDYITNMERDGQRQLVASQELPTDGPWDELEALGFVAGEPTSDLFRKVTLPDGWNREGSDHAMWSYLTDQRGIRMIAIFYKAAFYDRRAFWRFENPGYTASTQLFYGHGPAALPEKWELFTTDEKASFTRAVDEMERNIEKSPTIYGEHRHQLVAVRKLLAVS